MWKKPTSLVSQLNMDQINGRMGILHLCQLWAGKILDRNKKRKRDIVSDSKGRVTEGREKEIGRGRMQNIRIPIFILVMFSVFIHFFTYFTMF